MSGPSITVLSVPARPLGLTPRGKAIRVVEQWQRNQGQELGPSAFWNLVDEIERALLNRGEYGL